MKRGLLVFLLFICAIFSGCSNEAKASEGVSKSTVAEESSSEVSTAGGMETLTASKPLPQPRIVKKPKIAYITSSLTPESSQRNFHQAEIEVEHRGWEMISIVDVPTPSEERDALENVINQNVDAIVISYAFMDPLKDLIIEAREKGIGVYVVDTELKEGVIVSTTMASGVIGAQLAYYGADRLNRTGNVLIENILSAVTCREMTYGARGLLETAWPNMEVVGFENLADPGWQKSAYDNAEIYITKYGKDLNWIIAPCDPAAIVVIQAVEKSGLTKDDIIVTGFGGGNSTYAEIRKDSYFAATMSTPNELFAHKAFEIINQVQVEGLGIGEPGSMVPQTRLIYCDTVLTTLANVPAIGANIHEVFADSYYDPSDKDAWYNWGEPYRVE